MRGQLRQGSRSEEGRDFQGKDNNWGRAKEDMRRKARDGTPAHGDTPRMTCQEGSANGDIQRMVVPKESEGVRGWGGEEKGSASRDN